MRRFALLLVSLACLDGCLAHAQSASEPQPVPIKVVIVTTFEVGNDTGDKPGEFQYWVEREHLDRVLPFPGGVHPLRTNNRGDVLGIVTGMTIGPAASSIMALGLDPRFDLTHAYWLLAGIAGVDPNVASVGSAAYALNARLAGWAFNLTKNIPLAGIPAVATPEVAAFRATYTGFPNAQRPPFVLEGDVLASDSYWHGVILNHWAEDWVRIHTHGQGRFVMTAMEDSGVAEALTRLDAMHRADFRRFLDLRTASNYSEQAPGHSAAESITAPYIGGIPALEAAYRVGSVVVHTLVDQWEHYRDHLPGD